MAEELIVAFNQFGGSSLSQHHEQFSRYTKQLDALEPNIRQHVLNNLKALHRLEEIFLTKLLIRYGEVDKLKAVVFGGDRILNRIVGIYKPFIFQNLPLEAFKEDLFPGISYISRMRYIENLSKSIDRDDTGEDFFKWILAEYGIRAAVPLLCVCKKEFIIEIIHKYRIIFRERQLVKLHERFGFELIAIYYEELAKYAIKNFDTQPHFAKYLSLNDVTTFHHLLKYGQPKIGKRGFINFLKTYHSEVVNEPKKFNKLIKNKILYRFLSLEQYTQYFTNILPKKICDFSMYDCLQYVKLLPLKIRDSFMSGCFRAKYGFEIYKHQTPYLSNYFHLITLEERMKYNQFKVDENDMVEFYACDKAFPLIKEKLNLTSDINTRCELVLKLFKCAKHNNDENALLEASRYLCQRHKSDNSSIRSDIFMYIRDEYKLETLSAAFWKYWEEIIYTEVAIVEYPLYSRDMYEVLLHYKYLNGLDITMDLKKLLKEVGSYYIFMPTKCKKFQKCVLLQIAELLPIVFPDEPHNKSYPAAFLHALAHWNKSNPNDIISYYKYPAIIDKAVEHFDGYSYNDVIGQHVMLYHPEDPDEIKVRDKLFESFEKFSQNDSIWKFLIRKQLHLVEKYWECLFQKRNQGYYEIPIFYQLSLLHFTSIPSKIREKALDILKNDTNEDYAVKIALCALSHEKDFVDIINLHQDKFYPSEGEAVNVFGEHIRDTLDMRRHICWCLRNVTQAHKLIGPTLKFCVKDYFSRALPLLTYTLFNCPQTSIKEPLNILQTRSLTINKRAIFYCTKLYNNMDTCVALRVAGAREHNKSLQKFIFNRSFKAFCNICDSATWSILLEHLKFVFEKDSETINMVFNFNLIPRMYVGKFVEIIWHTIGKSFINHEYYRVLNYITADIMALLSDELCDDIIQYNLINAKEKFCNADIDFIYRYLLSSDDKMKQRFQLIALNTKVHLESNASTENFVVMNKRRQNIWFIFSEICQRILTDKETDVGRRQRFMSIFAEGIPQLPMPFSEMEFVIKAQVINYALASHTLLPPFLVAFLPRLQVAGDCGVDFYANIVKDILILIDDNVDYTLEVIQALLELSQRSADANQIHLLAAKLLPSTMPANEQHAALFKSLVITLEQQGANIALIVSEKLKNLSY